MKRCWMVRAGGAGRLYDLFQNDGIVAIGWAGIGDLTDCKTRDDIFRKMRAANPSEKEQSLRVGSGQLFRFRNEFKQGDRVVTYDPGSRRYNCGEVIGNYTHVPDAVDEVLTNQRRVRWSHETLRDDLSDSARNILGSTLTIFVIPPEVQSELWNERAQTSTAPMSIEQDIEAPDFSLRGVQVKAAEAIKDMLVALDPYDMQDLVAGLLRAMGYKTVVSPRGSDLGKDIIASPDGLGLLEPRIFVEVKHRPRERMGTPEIRSFVGGRRPGDKGLYVSTGGFTREAHYESERAGIPLTLVDFERLTELVLEHYEKFDAQARQLVPLQVIYWPVRL